MLIDSHCHLNYLDQPEEAWRRARANDIDGLLCISVEEKTIRHVLDLAQNDERIWATVGEHPEYATSRPDWIADYIHEDGVVAVGETGLDYFHVEDENVRQSQRDNFDMHAALAADANLPIVIHTRQAEKDTLDVLRAHPNVIGVLHCFTESWEMARQALDLGFYISISGIVTFKNAANVREVALQVPEDRLLIETDAPWLAPVPHRGETNEPAYVAATAAFLAELRGVPLEHLGSRTSGNFHRLFRTEA